MKLKNVVRWIFPMLTGISIILIAMGLWNYLRTKILPEHMFIAGIALFAILAITGVAKYEELGKIFTK